MATDPSVHIRNVIARTSVVDGDALLTPQLMARIVTAVTQAISAAQADEKSRQRDTRIRGGDSDCCCPGGESST